MGSNEGDNDDRLESILEEVNRETVNLSGK
jgi:hypothetical protein